MFANSGTLNSNFVIRLLAWICFAGIMISTPRGSAQYAGNGIHVGQAKVYDARQLTIMLDSLSQSLRGMSFINQAGLANALGNVQGYQSTDTSTSLFLNGAAGPQAAAVFANNLPAGSAASPAPTTTAPTSGSSPSFTINVNPAAAAASTNGGQTGYGPSAPTLPTLQTPPTYTPSFGPSSGDLLNDETNLTYQIFNLNMLLNRSLTDRTYEGQPRLQAVVGFDIDIEPGPHAREAVAIVEITASVARCSSGDLLERCSLGGRPEIVAMMPEQGSHNAATLTQKAHSFGGALAAQVFSVGLSAQKRSQTFYLYRDIDTISLQEPGTDPASHQIRFGWQFRPVLGRPTVEAGLRHMMVVLSLPASDLGDDSPHSPSNDTPEDDSPKLSIQVRTHWEPYDWKAQTTKMPAFCLHNCVDTTPSPDVQQPLVAVPRTRTYQQELGPAVETVKWFPSDSGTGIAMVTGKNFFPGTTVRLGNKTYTGNNDGLTLKSDAEMEILAPLSATLVGGVVSGRYGEAKDLKNRNSRRYSSAVQLQRVSVYPEGPDDVQLTGTLAIDPPIVPGGPTAFCSYDARSQSWTLVDRNGNPIALTPDGHPVNPNLIPHVDRDAFENTINQPRFLINGVPTTTTPVMMWNEAADTCGVPSPLGRVVAQLSTIVPAKDIKGSTLVSVIFPFEDFGVLRSGITYEPTLNIARLGSVDTPKLMISSTDPGDSLCSGTWSVQLKQCEVPGDAFHPACTAPKPRGAKGTPNPDPPIAPVLTCVGSRKLSLDISAVDLKDYKQILLVHRSSPKAAIDDTRVGAIPEGKLKPPTPAVTKGPTPPAIQQYSSQTIEVDGTGLDQIKTVLFDKTSLTIVNQDATSLIVSIPLSMTRKPANHDQIQLISDQNDPVLISLDITANPATAKKEK